MNNIINIAVSIFIGAMISFVYLYFIENSDTAHAFLIFIFITSIHYNTNKILDKLDG